MGDCDQESAAVLQDRVQALTDELARTNALLAGCKLELEISHAQRELYLRKLDLVTAEHRLKALGMNNRASKKDIEECRGVVSRIEAGVTAAEKRLLAATTAHGAASTGGLPN